MAARFGELLRRFVPLTDHDVAEILEFQSGSGHRFGEISLGWGLCRPDHIWRAWSAQLAQRVEHIDLLAVGIDTQALRHMPAKVAREFGVIPVRVSDDQLIVAVRPEGLPEAEPLATRIGRSVRFVLADAGQIERAVARHYAGAA